MKIFRFIAIFALVTSFLGVQIVMANSCPMQMNENVQMDSDMQMMDCHQQQNTPDKSDVLCVHCTACHLAFVDMSDAVFYVKKQFMHYNQTAESPVSVFAQLNLPPPKQTFSIA